MRILTLAIVAMMATLSINNIATADKPNFVFILADDMSWYGTETQMQAGFDVDWSDPSEAAGLLWEGGRLFSVDAKGRKTPLVPSNPDPDE